MHSRQASSYPSVTTECITLRRLFFGGGLVAGKRFDGLEFDVEASRFRASGNVGSPVRERSRNSVIFRVQGLLAEELKK